jgi:hypothetical protein
MSHSEAPQPLIIDELGETHKPRVAADPELESMIRMQGMTQLFDIKTCSPLFGANDSELAGALEGGDFRLQASSP